MFHYTDSDSWKAIRSQVAWKFTASQPRDPDRPVGAYFTDIPPTEENMRTLYKRGARAKEQAGIPLLVHWNCRLAAT